MGEESPRSSLGGLKLTPVQEAFSEIHSGVRPRVSIQCSEILPERSLQDSLSEEFTLGVNICSIPECMYSNYSLPE